MTGSRSNIAVQLSGHLRTFEACAPSLRRHLLDRYDCDVFIHTWDRIDHTTRAWYPDAQRLAPTKVDARLLEKVDAFYEPKSIKVETQDFLNEPGHYGRHPEIQVSLLGLKYMVYGQYQANLLREAYQREMSRSYEYVVVTRPDIKPLVDLDLVSYAHEFAFNRRCSIHLVQNAGKRKRGRKFLNRLYGVEIFYFAAPDTVSDICRLYLEFDKYYKEINNILPPGVYTPETSFFEYVYSIGAMPREYQFYFTVKRKEDKDDITLMPPSMAQTETLPDTENPDTRAKHTKVRQRLSKMFGRS